MARISYDEQTASAYKAVREIPREGLSDWREAVRRHVQPAPGMTLVDIGSGTGQFAVAFSEWFDLDVIAVEPSDAMRERIPRTPALQVLAGDAMKLPLADATVDAAWLSCVVHHIADLGAAAREIRRALRPGAPVLIRQAFHDRELGGVENIRWFPETARIVGTYPSLSETCDAFAAAGFPESSVEQVRETYSGTLADFLGEVDTLRVADTSMRSITQTEFDAGKERLRRAVESGNTEPRDNWLDLVVLR
jgi:ubiquinone/menaquinone biosynthesis C-methylase UbiE